MKVVKKISLLIAFIILAFAALSSFLLYAQRQDGQVMRGLASNEFKAADLIGELDGLLTRSDINILRMVAIGDPESIMKWKGENAQRFQRAQQAIAELKPLVGTQAQSLAELDTAYQALRKGMEHQISALEAGDKDRAAEINKREVKDNADRTFGLLVTLKQNHAAAVESLVSAELARSSSVMTVSLLATGLFIAAVVSGGALFGRTLMRQIGGEPSYAAHAAERMASGDLVTQIEVTRGDQTSILAKLNEMRSGLANMVRRVRENSEQVAVSAGEIAFGNANLSQRTEQQASALQQTAATMEELGSTVMNNAENSKAASQLATGAAAVAERGGEVVAEVVSTMQGINDSSRRIGDIIGVIDGIAFQTNILALNAAVEAARAGEQGRGFAVVAGEVRSLAQRSAEAAKEIKSLIARNVQQVDQGTGLVDRAGNTMQEIVQSIKRVSDIVAEISSATVEQSNGVSQVGQAVGQMDKSTQQNAALVEQSAAAAETLRGRADTLVGAVAAFKL